MLAGLTADLIVIIHFSFILFVLFGGLLLLRWRKLIWLHLPAVAWGIWIEFSGQICPLTPLEVWLRQRAGEQGYQHSFTEEYLLPLIYPEALTRELQMVLGIVVILLNLGVYLFVFRRWKK
jgi:hypothetical protein